MHGFNFHIINSIMKFRDTSEGQSEVRDRKAILVSSKLALTGVLALIGTNTVACDWSPSETNETATEADVDDPGTGTSYEFYSDGSAKRTIKITGSNPSVNYEVGEYITHMVCEPNKTGYDLIEANMKEPQRTPGHIICADGQITAEDFVNETPR